MNPSGALVLLRYSGEISIKARPTRLHFVRRLTQNVRDALSSEGITPQVRSTHDRVFVELPRGADPALLSRVFGVQSVAPVERRAGTSLEEIVCAGEALFRERVAGRRFAVRARRVGNRGAIRVSAREVERALGAALLPHSAGVDLDAPELTARVELTADETYFFPESVPGHAGLPVGVEGRAVALISGGFDSAVAAWHVLKRGVALDYVFANLGGATHLQGTLRVAKVLADRWSYGERPRFHVVDFGAVGADLQEHCEARYRQVVLKRLMLRAAEAVARERKAFGIVTGEALGQVSSQTLKNLAAISPATSLAILRPLIGSNKEEIIDRAMKIGTYDLSKVVGEYCALVPRKPATAATLSQVVAQEARLDASLLERAVEEREVFDLRDLDLEKLELPELEIERIPEGATVLDLRGKAEYATWHYPGALRMNFTQAMAGYASFDKGQHYVLYCEIGLKSAHLAELMRAGGFQAHHFRGGSRDLRRRTESGR